jgi:HECT-like Ubiquitin-conjugating enzyme (E2)-binding
MKIYYKPVSTDEASKNAKNSFQIEEIYLPAYVYEVLMTRLKDSNEQLPATANKLGEWDMGMLGRFESS